MIITISGKPGSGKSVVAKKITKIFNLKHYYIGQILREMAKKEGKIFQDFYKEADPEKVDKKVDAYQKKLGETEDNFIIEGRTSFYCIPNSIKIFLDVDIKVGAERIFNESKSRQERGFERIHDSLVETIKDIQDRIATEKKRYKSLYNLDHYDMKHYDLVVDTTKRDIGGVVDKIVKFVKTRP